MPLTISTTANFTAVLNLLIFYGNAVHEYLKTETNGVIHEKLCEYIETMI